MKKICRNCYYENPDSATYCCSCGSRLEPSSEEIKVYVDNKPEIKKFSNDDIRSIVAETIANRFGFDKAEIGFYTSLKYDLRLDFSDVLDLGYDLEEIFGLRLYLELFYKADVHDIEFHIGSELAQEGRLLS